MRPVTASASDGLHLKPRRIVWNRETEFRPVFAAL
jgi:hypothetical protein